ncbi:uncharacterized protein METZ01_LOCUS452493, partial [marine metagenome]
HTIIENCIVRGRVTTNALVSIPVGASSNLLAPADNTSNSSQNHPIVPSPSQLTANTVDPANSSSKGPSHSDKAPSSLDPNPNNISLAPTVVPSNSASVGNNDAVTTEATQPVSGPPATVIQPTTSDISAEQPRGVSNDRALQFSSGRTSVWKEGWALFKRSPILGYGFHADRLLLNTHLHNSIAHAFFQTGLMGGIPFVSALVISWIFMFRMVRRVLLNSYIDKHIVVQVAGVLTFLTTRSLPESTGAFFGVDWL